MDGVNLGMGKTEFRVLLLALIVCCILPGCSYVEFGTNHNQSTAMVKIEKVLDLNDTVYNPFLREPIQYYSESKLSMQNNKMDYTNYWIQTVIAITKMRCDGDFEYAANVINREMETFYRVGYFPRPAYQQFGDGWVSSMDAPVIAVASQMLYEHTGDEKYKEFVNTLSAYMVKDVSEHGYVGKVGDGRWLYEYADNNASEETAEFVLNGSLLGTLGTAIIANVTNNYDLQKLVNEQIQNYKIHCSKYTFRNKAWCYYALNKKSVNQPHYVIYEIRILDALNEVTGDVFFKEQADLRRNMLLMNYQGYVEDGKLYFLRSGAPHYYYIDIFDTKLTFLDNESKAIDEIIFSGKEIGDSIPCCSVPQSTERIYWTASTEWYDVHIGEISVVDAPINVKDKILQCVFKASSDGGIENGILRITPHLGKTNLMCDFLTTQSIQAKNIYIVELENMSEEEYSMNIILYDSKGKVLSRYLPNLHVGKCVVPFSLLGFVERDELSDLKNFNLRIYASGKEKIDVRIGNIYKFENTAEYLQYLRQTEYVPIWQ